MHKRSRLAAQACRASILGGDDDRCTVIPSRDMLALFFLNVGGHSSRDDFLDALQLATGFSSEWPQASTRLGSYVHSESQMLHSYSDLLGNTPGVWPSKSQMSARRKPRHAKTTATLQTPASIM